MTTLILEKDLKDSFEEWPVAALIERFGVVIRRNRLARLLTGCIHPIETPLAELMPGAEFRLSETQRVRFDGLLLRRYGPPLKVHATGQPADFGSEACRILLLMESEEAKEIGEPSGLRVENVLDALPEATAITNGTLVVHVNEEFTRLFGWPQGECIGRDMAELIIPEGRYHERELMLHMLRTTGRCSIETVRRTRDGKHLDISMRGVQVRLGGEMMGTLATYRDIRMEKKKEASLAFEARHDLLTGLPNRVQFVEKVELMLGRLKRRPDRQFTVVFLDLDGFKKVNDSLGHAAGDQLLVQVAERLTNCLRPQDAVARFGGDEFALLLDESGSRQMVDAVVRRIQQDLQRPVNLHPFGTGLVASSMGVVIVGSQYGSAEAILAIADSAMYEAKVAGKARHIFR